MRRGPSFLRSIGPAALLGVLATVGPHGPAYARSGTGETVAAATTAGGKGRSLLGSYLAGRVARSEHDISAAADYYTDALTRDPDSDVLLGSAFEMEATEGNWARVEPLAERLAKLSPDNRMARLYLGLREFKAKRYAEADEHFKATAVNPIGEMASNIARAWTRQAEGRTKEAVDLLEQSRQPDWAQRFYRYHKALLLDVAGRSSEARVAYDRVYKADQTILRTTLAFAQHAANSGDVRSATTALRGNLERARGEGHPTVRALLQQLEAGEPSQLLVSNASEGLSEMFFGLGEALTGEGGIGPGTMFLQFALYLEPKMSFALASLANVYESTRKYERAIAAYDRVPKGGPLDPAIEIRKAINLNSLERVDEAKQILESAAERDPTDLKPLDALGSIMRGHKRFEEAVVYYNRAIGLIAKPDARHWSYFYARGTSHERLKRWPQAEADLQVALKLAPEQPLVLNYLGYSWVDQGRNLKQGMALIEKAVRLKPDDGYIVDSLGWAHYRQGNYKEAVKYLERAVEIRPEDPVLNDHLGDAYWRVGREREARFQWEQSLTLKPEPEDAEKINKKLKTGLAPVSQARGSKALPTAAAAQKRKTVVRNQQQPTFNPYLQ